MKFKSINFGCRVNAAETNQLSQQLIDQNYTIDNINPDVVIVNTCAITKKGEYESISKIKKLIADNPKIKIIATGCANLDKLKGLKNVTILKNIDKDKIITSYSPEISDKFSHTHRYLLKVQSGCTQNCTFCIVPSRRSTLNFLSIDDAVKTVNSALQNGYIEVIITGVNLAQYLPGLSNLVEALLTKTEIKLISFGSIPLLCIDEKFISLLSFYGSRLSNFLHIPLQSGSDKILKLMHRPYNKEKIINTFNKLKLINTNNNVSPSLSKRGLGGDFSFGTDIIVGFPTETDTDFQQTYDLCQKIGFNKIHVFKYSPRPGTVARELFLQSEKISKNILLDRSKKLRNLVL
jgi:threonylcarbamoyladenosine tRNA methylthiotransferase MtaB